MIIEIFEPKNVLGCFSGGNISNVAWHWKFFPLQYVDVLLFQDFAVWTMPILFILGYKGTVVSLTVSYAVNMISLVIWYGFCLLLAQLCYIFIYIWKVEIHVQITALYEMWLLILNNRTARTLPGNPLGVGSECKVIHIETFWFEQDWTHLSVLVGLPLSFECDCVVFCWICD
jgi:hypothetical protein